MQVEREILAPLVPQPVREAMRLDGVEALEIEQRIDEAVRRRVAVDGGGDIGAEGVAEARFVFQRIGVSLADQFARHVRMVEPLGDTMHHRLLERVMVQDRRIDEARKLGLAPRHLFGLVADARPDRVDLVEPADRLELLLGHECLRLIGPV